MGITSPGQTAKYEKHIDGLRGVAIALVLLYHFGLAGAVRGFLGVDIFFVISGYLVGGHVLRESAAGQFRLIDFYFRRIIRILPALTAVATTSLLAGYFILLPEDLLRLAFSIKAAMQIIANQHFFASQDYFGPGKLDNYFLHSWSLSIEEQFYLCFPPICLLLTRLSIPKFQAIAFLALASWGWQWWLSSQGHTGAFYFLFARSWELLFGVLVALAPTSRNVGAKSIGLLALAGMAMAIMPAFLPNVAEFWYSMALQAICVSGTALLLWVNSSQPENKVAAILSLRWIVWVGLISYSLYLVHWPLLTLTQYWTIIPLSLLQRIALLVLSVGLAWLSWRWIEMPTRTWGRSHPNLRGHVIAAGLITMAVFIFGGRVIASLQGLPERVPAAALAKLKQRDNVSPLRKKCHSDEVWGAIAPAEACKLGLATTNAHFAIWADSHGVELVYAVGEILKSENEAILQLTSSGCPPLVGVDFLDKPGCLEHNDASLKLVKNNVAVRTVVLTWHQNAYRNISANARFAGCDGRSKGSSLAGKELLSLGRCLGPNIMCHLRWPGLAGTQFRTSNSANRFWHASSKAVMLADSCDK